MTLYTSQLKENEVDPNKGTTSFFIVRRIGMTKPPVKLGVGKNS